MNRLRQVSMEQTGALIYLDSDNTKRICPLYSDNLVRELVEVTSTLYNKVSRFLEICHTLSEQQREVLVSLVNKKFSLGRMNMLRTGFEKSHAAGMLNPSISYYK